MIHAGTNSALFKIFLRKFLMSFRHCSVVRAVPIRLRHWLALLGRYHMGAICKIKNFDSAPSSFPRQAKVHFATFCYSQNLRTFPCPSFSPQSIRFAGTPLLFPPGALHPFRVQAGALIPKGISSRQILLLSVLLFANPPFAPLSLLYPTKPISLRGLCGTP